MPETFNANLTTDHCNLCETGQHTFFVALKKPTFKAVVCYDCLSQIMEKRERRIGNGKDDQLNSIPVLETSDLDT